MFDKGKWARELFPSIGWRNDRWSDGVPVLPFGDLRGNLFLGYWCLCKVMTMEVFDDYDDNTINRCRSTCGQATWYVVHWPKIGVAAPVDRKGIRSKTMIAADSEMIWGWGWIYWKVDFIMFLPNTWTSQLDSVWSHGGHHKLVLAHCLKIGVTTPVARKGLQSKTITAAGSKKIWGWGGIHLKIYLITFPQSARTSQLDSVWNRGDCCKLGQFCGPNWTSRTCWTWLFLYLNQKWRGGLVKVINLPCFSYAI